MSAFLPRQRTEIYSEVSARVLGLGPFTSTELGEGVDNIIFGFADQLYELYVEMGNALALLSLDTTTGSELDAVGSEYPDLEPRLAAVRGTGNVTVSDPNITKIATTIPSGGANTGDNFLNTLSAAALPSSGTVIVGARGSSSFEYFAYTSKVGNVLHSTSDLIAFDHGLGEDVVLATVGDRTFTGPYSAGTQATAQAAAKLYTTVGPFTIFDGDATGIAQIQANVIGPSGNTPSGTILRFIGTPPFAAATVVNGAAVSNGLAAELDADYRQRIRRERQSLSTASIDALTSVLLATNYQGQRIKFIQNVEDPNPAIPSILYIDDGSGFTPGQAVSTGVVLVDNADGTELRGQIPFDYLPIVTLMAENNTRVFTGIVVSRNGTPMVQGDGALQYRVQPDNGVIHYGQALNPGDHIEITTITHYTGLVALANRRLYGDRSDRTNYPGVVGEGQWIQLRTPAIQFITIDGSNNYDTTKSPTDVQAAQKQNFLDYVNNLGIGGTLVKNRLLALAFVDGVKDFVLTTPSGDTLAADGTLLKTTLGNITLS